MKNTTTGNGKYDEMRRYALTHDIFYERHPIAQMLIEAALQQDDFINSFLDEVQYTLDDIRVELEMELKRKIRNNDFNL